MQLGCYSFVVIFVLHATLQSTIALTGCIVTLLNSVSDRRKVLCADPKTPIDYIPTDLPQRTDMLIISQQNVTSIDEKDFYTIPEMTTLSLTQSNLQRIHKNALKYLSRLIVLDLSGNNLVISDSSLPAEVFTGLSELELLRLTNNPLAFVPEYLFSPVSKTLRKIFLNKCDKPALKISPSAFKGLHKVEELDLRESGLVTLHRSIETDFRAMKSLTTLLLSGNNFVCDCQLRWLYFYLTQIQETVTINLDGDKEPTCSSPEKLLHKRFPTKDEKLQLRYTDFSCASVCSIIGTKQLTSGTGANVNLTCECFTDPIRQLIWLKNGHVVDEVVNKYRFFRTGHETFQSTLNIMGLQPVDSGNWSCKIDRNAFQNFSLQVKSDAMFFAVGSINIYLLVGLGSSLFLVSVIIVIVIMLCHHDSLCNWRNQHPMVICGYEGNIRKLSIADGDVENRYNQQDGRFNTSFYENSIPFDFNLSQYNRTNHLFSDDLLSEKNYVNHKPTNDKMLNVYCGCNYNSEDDRDNTEMNRSSYSNRTTETPIKQLLDHKEKFRQLGLKVSKERPLPKMKQCPLHGSSGTLTRIPGEKPCPVHGSTATLPTRLSSRKVEHRFGCPKHSTDNVSLTSLNVDSRIRSPSCASVNRMPTKLNHNSSVVDVTTPSGYRPCPLHGDVLSAINENVFDSLPTQHGAHFHNNKTNHSKVLKNKSLKSSAIGCESSSQKAVEPLRNHNDRYNLLSINISNSLTSPVQSSLSSSPLLTSDVHGTFV